MRAEKTEATTIRRVAFNLLCVLLLMWPALINRQPFFFPDTTSYVRAADKAVSIVSGGRVTTAWSTERKSSPRLTPDIARSAPAPAPASPVIRGNDPDKGIVMAGRSPYFGMLLWLSWVTSSFWVFVFAQALVALALVRLTLRHFGVDSIKTIGLTVLGLSVFSTLPFYIGMLLADALAGFGILSFLLLVTGWRELSKLERGFLIGILLVSCASHLTHILMLAAMVGVVVLRILTRSVDWRAARPALATGVAVIALSLASVAFTSMIVKAAFGKPPALVPLLTARFMADGPGRRFVENGCGGKAFAICGVPDRGQRSANKFLWSTDPTVGTYLTVDSATRERLAAEDKDFAIAVLRAYPGEQGRAIIGNSVEQFFRFGLYILNVSCGPGQQCAINLPPVVLETMQRSAAGLNQWPQDALSAVVYASAAIGLAILLWSTTFSRSVSRTERQKLMMWILLIVASFAINAILGGALSEPQSRYQARIIWIVPMLGMVCLWLLRRGREEVA